MGNSQSQITVPADDVPTEFRRARVPGAPQNVAN